MSRRDTAAYPPSWYAASAAPLPPQPRLEGELQADVCILGAGYTGLSAALELAEAGYRVVVLESERIGWGASGRNGGQAIVGYGCEQDTLEGLVGLADARRLFDFSREGMALSAGSHPSPRHRLRLARRSRQRADQAAPGAGAEALAGAQWPSTYDYPLEWWDRERLRKKLGQRPLVSGAIYDRSSGHLHPLEYAFGLARAALAAGVRIFERSRVVRLERGAAPVLHTDAGRVRCDFAVLAGNAWLRGIAPELESRIMPVGTYIGATTPLGEERARALIRNDMAVADVNWALDYFRLSRDHRLLFGGRASYSTLPPPNLRSTMARRMRRVFPQLADVDIEYVWGGYVDISRNRAPHWGRLTPNVYFAQGFQRARRRRHRTGRARHRRGHPRAIRAPGRLRPHPASPFPGGRLLRTPMLVAAMAWYKLRDALW